MTGTDYARAAGMAYKTLLSLNITKLPVNPLNIIKRCNNTVVHTYDEAMLKYGMTDRQLFKLWYMEGQDAVTIRRVFGNGSVGYELFYDSHAYSLRRRFSLAHELGHILLGHRMETQDEEREANHFASVLLMPRPALDLFVDGIIDEDLAVGLTTTVFCVSASAAQIALKDLPSRRDKYYQQIQQLFDHYITESEDVPEFLGA